MSFPTQRPPTQMRSFVFFIAPESLETILAAGTLELELAFRPPTDGAEIASTDTPEVLLHRARWRLGHVMQLWHPQTWASTSLCEVCGQLDKRPGFQQCAGERCSFDPAPGHRAVRRVGRDWSGEVGFLDRTAPAPTSASDTQPPQWFLHFSVSVDCSTTTVKYVHMPACLLCMPLPILYRLVPKVDPTHPRPAQVPVDDCPSGQNQCRQAAEISGASAKDGVVAPQASAPLLRLPWCLPAQDSDSQGQTQRDTVSERSRSHFTFAHVHLLNIGGVCEANFYAEFRDRLVFIF